jgi:predicted peroxiredoxin
MIRIYTKKRLERHIAEQVKLRTFPQMEAISRNAAKYAIHYYVAVRSIDQWHKILDEAAKDGNKYMSLADLIMKAGFKK